MCISLVYVVSLFSRQPALFIFWYKTQHCFLFIFLYPWYKLILFFLFIFVSATKARRGVLGRTFALYPFFQLLSLFLSQYIFAVASFTLYFALLLSCRCSTITNYYVVIRFLQGHNTTL